jgi:hypothetical protein
VFATVLAQNLMKRPHQLSNKTPQEILACNIYDISSVVSLEQRGRTVTVREQLTHIALSQPYPLMNLHQSAS